MRGRVCRLQLLLILASAVILWSESRGTRDHSLLSQIRDFPFCLLLRLTGLRWRYSTPLHTGLTERSHVSSLYNFGKDRIEITTSNISSIRCCGNLCWFRSSGLVATSLHLFIFLSMDTFVKHLAMVCVHESHLRINMFANSLPRNAYMPQYCTIPIAHHLLLNRCHWFTNASFENLFKSFCTLHYMFRQTLVVIRCLIIVGEHCCASVLLF
jgi:hypothetical protein